MSRHRSAEDIPRIIIQGDSWRKILLAEAATSQTIMVDGNIPVEMVKEITRLIGTSENGRRLQEYMIILDKPADVRGTAIRL